MRKRSNKALAPGAETSQSGEQGGNMKLIVEGDDRCLVGVGSAYKTGDLVGVHLAALGRDAVRRVQIEGERRFLHSDLGECTELAAGDWVIGRVQVVARTL